MKVCHNCQAEQPSNLATTCMYCGYDLKDNTEITTIKSSDSDKDTDQYSSMEHTPDLDDVSLDIETPSDMLNNETSENKLELADDDDLYAPIGQSAPFMPEEEENQYQPIQPENGDEDSFNKSSVDETGKLKKLSDEELKSIEKNLYRTNKLIDNEQEKEILNKIKSAGSEDEEHNGFNNAPIIPPKKSSTGKNEIITNQSEEPVERKRPAKPRSLAFFHKNYIQVPGINRFYENDELDFNDQTFVLKPKKMTTIWIAAASTAASIIFLMFIIAWASGSGSNLGRITGVALGANGQPIVTGGEITLPESGKKTRINPQGFFQFSHLESGTHKIEYRIDGQLVNIDYATVIDNKENLIFLRPDAEIIAQNDQEGAGTQNPTEPVVKPASTETRSKTKTQEIVQKPVEVKPKKKEPAYREPTSTYSKITLSSNIGTASLAVDGQVLGAGNLTYGNIQPGNHDYTVSADGYNDVNGSLYLKPGDNIQLKVKLSPMTVAKKKETMNQTEDYFYSGVNSYKDGNYQTAISDFNKVIKDSPSNADAYFYRAYSYSYMHQMDKAFDDFIKAAEIYQFKKDYTNSKKCYDEALAIDEESIPAYIGRGNLFLLKNETMAATADFDMVRKIDRRNFQAYYGLGKAAFQQERFNKAVDYFKDARSIDESNPMVYQYLMLSYMAQDDIKNVQKSFEKFQEIATDAQMDRFNNNKTYSAIHRIIETD